MTSSDSARFFAFLNERDPPAVGEEGSVHVLSWRAVKTASGDLHPMLMREGGPQHLCSGFRAAGARW